MASKYQKIIYIFFFFTDCIQRPLQYNLDGFTAFLDFQISGTILQCFGENCYFLIIFFILIHAESRRKQKVFFLVKININRSELYKICDQKSAQKSPNGAFLALTFQLFELFKYTSTTNPELPLFGRFYVDLSPDLHVLFFLVKVVALYRVAPIRGRGPPAQNHLRSGAQQEGNSRGR